MLIINYFYIKIKGGLIIMIINNLKKMLIVFALIGCILSVSADPIHFDKKINNLFGNNIFGDNGVVYVSVDGTGDGSSPDSPLGSLKQALSISKPNGIIKVSSGVYKGAEHTGIMIDKNINIEGDVDTVFDGEKRNFIFMANGQGLNVNVSNIKFIMEIVHMVLVIMVMHQLII
jgi:hypothetical protein